METTKTQKVHITLPQLLKHFPAGTKFSYMTRYGEVEVTEIGYDGRGELYFIWQSPFSGPSVHYAEIGEVILVSMEDYKKSGIK